MWLRLPASGSWSSRISKTIIHFKTASHQEIEMSKKSVKDSLSTLMGMMDRKFGVGTLMALDGRAVEKVPVFSTGSFGLDLALGVGGLPRGRIIEIYGPESSGKTTMALHAVAAVQAQGGVAAFVDAEHAIDTTYAAKLGVKLDEVLISQPDHGEQALQITESLAQSGMVSLVVVDSVAALVPKAELEGEMGDHHVGLQARLMSQGLRKLASVCNKGNTTVLFINQIRHKIGVMFGSPETTSGGNALKFYATIRLDIRRIGAVKEGEVVLGNRTRIKVVKNKLAPPFRNVEFDLMFGEGVNRMGEVVDLCVAAGSINKAGAWYSIDEIRMGQGRKQAIAWLQENPKRVAQLEAALLSPEVIEAEVAS
jgi:recombination protein RecA